MVRAPTAPSRKLGWEQLEFFRGEWIIDVINSTELRAVGVDVIEIGLFPTEAVVNDPDALIEWELRKTNLVPLIIPPLEKEKRKGEAN